MKQIRRIFLRVLQFVPIRAIRVCFQAKYSSNFMSFKICASSCNSGLPFFNYNLISVQNYVPLIKIDNHDSNKCNRV
jgi:hypothetical protein